MKNHESTLENHENQAKIVTNKNIKKHCQRLWSPKNRISSDGNMCPRKSVSPSFEKKTIAIALPPKFDDRSSLVGTRMLMMTITHNHHFHWCQESRILLTAYALFITLMFGLQIAAIVLTVLYKVTKIYIHTTLFPHQDCFHHHHVKVDHGQGEADEHTRNLLKSSLSTYTTEAPRDAVSNNDHSNDHVE